MSERWYDQISRHGLTRVYCCDKAVAHIIFVHGLFGHPEKTWTGIKAVSKVAQRVSLPLASKTGQGSGADVNDDGNTDTRPNSASNSIFWPAVLLPQIVPDTQIWTWGYDADIDDYWSSASQNTVSQHATNLLSDVADLLESKSCSLPIIFVVHSLGGLIVKAAVNMSCGAKANRFKIVVPVVRGILFLGTPHRGSNSASIGKVAYRVTKAAARRPNEKLLQALEKNSDTLDQINNSFLQTLEEHKGISIASFREEKETRKYLIFSTTVVEADSARIGLPGEEINSIPENHRNMAKLSSAEDVGFKRVSAQIRRWIDLLPIAFDDKEDHFDCVRSLDSPITKTRLNNIAASHSETLKWLFENDIVDFSLWLQDSQKRLGSIYWIQGKPGSGKSTLMKFAMMNPKLAELLQASENIPYVVAGFFFHDRGTMVQKSISGMLQELLHSILIQSSSLRQFVHPIYKALVESQQTQLPIWDIVSLLSAFKAIIEQRQALTRLCLFLDALDEHHGNNDYLAELMKILVALADGEVVKIKLCLASRSWDTFVTSFSGCPGFKIHDHTYNDIQAYTLSEFTRSSLNVLESTAPQDVRSAKLAALATQVTDKARGVFIWVRIVVDEISKGLRDRTPYFVLEERLAKMPEELKDLYQHTLERIEPDHVEESYIMLQIALCTLCPLSLRTFVNVTSHALWARIPGDEAVEDMIQRVVSRSGGLLEVIAFDVPRRPDHKITETVSLELQTEANETSSRESENEESIDQQTVVQIVQFIHQTVKEYIQGRTDSFGLNRIHDGTSGYLYILASAVCYTQDWALVITLDIFEYARFANQKKDMVSQENLYAILSSISEDALASWLERRDIEYYRTLLVGLNAVNQLLVLTLVAGLFEFVDRYISIHAGAFTSGPMSAMCAALIGPRITSVQISRREMLNSLFKHNLATANSMSRVVLTDAILAMLITDSPLIMILLNRGRFDQDEKERVSAMVCLLDHGADPNVKCDIGIFSHRNRVTPFELCIRQESAEVVRIFGQYGGTLGPEMVLPMGAIWQMIFEPSAVLKEVMEIMERKYPEMMESMDDFKDDGVLSDLLRNDRISAAAIIFGAVTAIGTGMSSFPWRPRRYSDSSSDSMFDDLPQRRRARSNLFSDMLLSSMT